MSTYNSRMMAAEYFTKYPTRFFSMHVQDLDIKAGGTPVVNGRGGGRAQTSRSARAASTGRQRSRLPGRPAAVKNFFSRAGDADDNGERRGTREAMKA